MTGFARLVMTGLLVVMALGAAAPSVAAQGVGFEDMPGIQQAVTRSYSGETGFDPAAGAGGARELRKPVVALLLTAVYSFDTEANAVAAYELLQTDMNATGVGGKPLELAPTTLPLTLEHVAASAVDTSTATRYDFTLALARDGVFIYTVIAITSGAPPKAAVAAAVRAMAAGQAGPEPVAFDAAGGSTGGLWGKMPARAAIERHFRGVTSIEDATPFPA
jgi:hypothetical protein